MLLETELKNTHNTTILDASRAITLRPSASPNFRYIVSRLNGLSADSYTDMEYDFSEHGRIIDTDSLVTNAFKKKRQAITKEGFELVSKNKRNVDYINKRISEIEFVTGTSFETIVEEITENLVNYNNCFLLKYKNEKNSTGRVREVANKTVKPIAGLYVLATPTIDTANNKQGQIIRYRHRISDYYTKIFKADDIVHIYQNKRTGMTVGTPPLESVRDDVYTLRNIEQCTETMIYRNASPFIHVKVGDKDQPASLLQDGSSEVDVYSAIIDNMSQYGGVATPHRVNIELKGSESQALRLESYLTYFQNRVLSGLGVSKVDLSIGDSTTGGSAAIISQSLKDDVRAYQKTISNFITNEIFNELLMESKYYYGRLAVPKEEKVVFTFIENDIDQRIKIESHYLNMVQGGLVTKEFAMQFIKSMEKKDIQPDPPVEKGSVSTPKKTGSTSNALKTKASAPKRAIRDSALTLHFNSSESDVTKLITYAQQELLLTAEYYDIINNLYNTALEVRETLGEEYAYQLIEETLVDLALEQVLINEEE